MPQNDLVTAKELVDCFDPELKITVHTINHWINLRILPVAKKIGRIRYLAREKSISIINRVRELQNMNYPLSMIAQTLENERTSTGQSLQSLEKK